MNVLVLASLSKLSACSYKHIEQSAYCTLGDRPRTAAFDILGSTESRVRQYAFPRRVLIISSWFVHIGKFGLKLCRKSGTRSQGLCIIRNPRFKSLCVTIDCKSRDISMTCIANFQGFLYAYVSCTCSSRYAIRRIISCR